MAYNPKTWGNKEKLTSSGLNQCRDSLEYLYSRFIPSVVANDVARGNLCLYIARYDGIDPNQSSGTGRDGATWSKALVYQNGIVLALSWPNSIFADTPIVIGHSVECTSGAWGIAVLSFWGLTNSFAYVALRDTGGPQYAITTTFGLTVVLLGTRARAVT